MQCGSHILSESGWVEEVLHWKIRPLSQPTSNTVSSSGLKAICVPVPRVGFGDTYALLKQF